MKPDRFNLYRSTRTSDDAYARFALHQTEDRPSCPHPFVAACRAAGVEPTAAEAGKWRAGKGSVLEGAWERAPQSKHLPALRQP